MKWLEENRPVLASAIMSLPWVADGIEETERQALRELVNVETLYGTDSAPALVDKPWITEGVDELGVSVMIQLRILATYDEVSAASIARMPFLDTLETIDLDTLGALADLGRPVNWRGLFRAVVQKPWVGDGLSESEVAVLRHLRWIANGGEGTALRILGMPFLQARQLGDGPAAPTVIALWTLGTSSQDTLRAVVEKPWVEDGLDESETAFVQNLGRLAGRDEATASRIADNLGVADATAVDVLAVLAFRHQELFRAVVERPWIHDGLDESESEILKYLNWTALGGDDVALWLATFVPTVDSDDVDALAALWALGAYSQKTLRTVMGSPWAEDGLDGAETVVLRNLGWLANRDEAVALEILGMPFLQTVEPADGGAMEALRRMAAYQLENFERVMAHPTLSGGVTDEWARVVTVLGGVSGYDADRIDVLLDPRRVSVEERVIDLPLAGTVTLAIVRTRPGAESVIMDFLEHSVRSSEAFMGAPLPTSRVTLHFDEAYRFGGAGLHFSTHIGMLSRYDVDDGSAVARDAAPIIAHEVGHFYWGGGKPWVVEGGASFLEAVSEHARTGQSIDAGGHPCTHAGNITQLEGQGGEGEFGCYYAFGERLLIDLYRNLGEDTFRRGFLDLYLRTKAGSLEIEDYRAAFTAVAPDRAADIDRIAARWYEGAETPDAFVPDESPVNPRLPGLSGRIADAYVTTIGGLRLVGFSTRHIYDIWLQLRFIVNPESERRELSLSIEGYFEDGFAFWLREMTIPVLAGQTSGNIEVFRGAAPTYQWAPGRYVVYVYSEGQKVAEVEFEVVP